MENIARIVKKLFHKKDVDMILPTIFLSQKIDAGNFIETTSGLADTNISKPPYEKTMVYFCLEKTPLFIKSSSEIVKAIYLVIDSKQPGNVYGIVKTHGNENNFFIEKIGCNFDAICSIPKADNSTAFAKRIFNDEGDLIGNFLFIALLLFGYIANNNITYETVTPDAAENKKLIKAGKYPMYEYKKLVLNPEQPRVVHPHQGGTHASPRMHTRRGHNRKLKSGKTIWINDCTVGKSSAGVIEKDYLVACQATASLH